MVLSVIWGIHWGSRTVFLFAKGKHCVRQTLDDLGWPLQTHLPQLHAFLQMKQNALCFQALHPRCAFLRVVLLTALHGLLTSPLPPRGPLGKFLPFSLWISHLKLLLPWQGTNHSRLPETEGFIGIQYFSAKHRKLPSMLGQLRHSTPPLLDRIDLSFL